MVEKRSPPEGLPREQVAADESEEQGLGRGLPGYVPAEVRDVSFPVSLRGYSKRAVDVYVERVNRVIAELEVSRSPRSAVRHALHRVTEQVDGILDRAREAAEQITASAREEAEESIARAKAEAAEIVVSASTEADRTKAEGEELLAKAKSEANSILTRSRTEADEIVAQARAEAAEHSQRSEQELTARRAEVEAQLHELQADTEGVREERRRLLDGIHETATHLEEVATGAAARFPPQEPAEQEEERMPRSEAAAESGPGATDAG